MLKNGMRVRVYWNLHKNKYSVQDAKTNRVVAHVSAIALQDCKLTIRKSGQERARKEGRKNVHAFVTGTFYSDRRFKNAWEVCGGKQVKYNPYKNDTFMRENKPIHTSPTITMGTYDDRPIVWAI